MAKLNPHCAVTVTFLIISVISVSGQFSTKSNHKWTGAHSRSRTYFDELSHINKLARQRLVFESSVVQEELEKLSATLLGFSGAFRNHLFGKPSTNLTDGSDEAEGVNLQELLLSATRRMTAGNSSSACVNDTTLFIISLFQRQKWALQFLDSFGKPGPGITEFRVNFVGDYSQCRGISALSTGGSRRFHGNYCTLKASLRPPSPMDLLAIQLGACLPDTCSSEDSTLFVDEVIHLLGINGTLQGETAECHTTDREMTSVTVVAIAIIVIIGMLMIIGTTFDLVFIQWPKWKAATQADDCPASDPALPGPSHTINEEENQAPVTETTSLLANVRCKKQESSFVGICPQVLLAFSVFTNGSKVLNTSQPEGSLSAIHGIRFLSMSWVVLGHILVFGIQQFGNLYSLFLGWLKDWSFDAISNAFVSVDTFFTLSGLLTAYLTLNEIKKSGWKINWPLFYFHRFWRLTPPYMLTLLAVTGLQQYLGSGPLWPSLEPGDKENCENYWWTNLLYINNLVDVETMCFGHSWYLANDMQFYLLSPLMIIPFYFHRALGAAVCLGFLLVSWITTGVLSTQNEWPPTLVSASPRGGYATFQEYYYIKPWCRIGPYIIGLMAGAYLSLRRNKRLPKPVVYLGWVVAIATGLAVVYGLHGDISGDNISSISVAALYNTVARSAWGASVSWVIIACASGSGGFVNSILSWSPFVVLGRLTYMAYLIHPCLLFVYFQNQETLVFLSYVNLTVIFCGLVVIINLVAFVLMLAFESPWIGLEKIFIKKKSKN